MTRNLPFFYTLIFSIIGSLFRTDEENVRQYLLLNKAENWKKLRIIWLTVQRYTKCWLFRWDRFFCGARPRRARVEIGLFTTRDKNFTLKNRHFGKVRKKSDFCCQAQEKTEKVKKLLSQMLGTISFENGQK